MQTAATVNRGSGYEITEQLILQMHWSWVVLHERKEPRTSGCVWQIIQRRNYTADEIQSAFAFQ